jgi:chromosome segregation ATPase
VNYCWSFPSKQAQRATEHLAQLEAQVPAEQAAVVETRAAIDAARALRPESAQRSAKLAQVAALRSEIGSLTGTLEALKENDPVEIAKQAAEVEMCRVAANR